MATLTKLILVLLSVSITSIAGLNITYLGCFNSVYVDDLSTEITDNPTHVTERLTHEYCAKICAGYQYMAIKNSKYCNCGNSPSNSSTLQSSGDCNVACHGNSAQMCGGSSYFSAFSINVDSLNVLGKVEKGCYADLANRDVNGAWVRDLDEMTQDFCAKTCCNLGFPFMGLQSGLNCFCGDTYDSYGPSTVCTANCVGNPSQNCGGVLSNKVFALTCGPNVGNDPHFMMSSGEINFCFNLHGKDEEIFNLISDSENDITVRGETFETVVKGNLLSYFSKIGIYARHQQITFGRNDFQINSQRFNYDGYVESPIQVDDITITLIHDDPYKFIVKIGDDIKLMITRSSNQHTDGFMGVYLLTRDGFTSNVNGIIGELIDTNFKLIEYQEGMQIEFDDHHESVPVSPVSMFSPDSKGSINCYFYSGVIGDKKHYQESTLL